MCIINNKALINNQILVGNLNRREFQPANTYDNNEAFHQNGIPKTYCVNYGLAMLQLIGYDIKYDLGYSYELWQNYKNTSAKSLYLGVKSMYEGDYALPRIDDDQAKVLSMKGYMVSIHYSWSENDYHMALVYNNIGVKPQKAPLMVVSAGKYNQVNYEHQAYPLENCQGRFFWLWKPGNMMKLNDYDHYVKLMKIWEDWKSGKIK